MTYTLLNNFTQKRQSCHGLPTQCAVCMSSYVPQKTENTIEGHWVGGMLIGCSISGELSLYNIACVVN